MTAKDWTELQAEADWLQSRGYDGRYLQISPYESCGCGIGDLRPCGEFKTGCVPAREVAGDDFAGYVPARRTERKVPIGREEQ